MNNKTNFTTPNGNDFRSLVAQASGQKKPNTESLDLFAEELPEQRDLAEPSTASTVSTYSSVGGTSGTLFTAGTLF